MKNISRKQVEYFLRSNLSKEPYNDLRFYITEWYPKIEIDFEKVPASLFEKAEKDLMLFSKSEENRAKIEGLCVGDYIKDENGNLTQVGIFLYDGKFQDTNGGSFHVNESGQGSFSGGFTGNVLNEKDFKFSGEYKPFNCWIFSEFWAGANRGVHSYIMAKVWEEK